MAAAEAVDAGAESGLRARFSYGYQQGQPNERLMDLDDLADIAARWPSCSADGRLHLGLAWRGPAGPTRRPDLQVVHLNNALPVGLSVDTTMLSRPQA